MPAAKQVNSDQVALVLAGKLVASNTGGVRRQFFSVTSPATGIIGANADIVMLTWLPTGARILGGVFKNTAGGAACVGGIGTYNSTTFAAIDAAHYKGAAGITDLTAATSQTFADTIALGFGEALTVPVLVGFLSATATFQAAALIYGYMDYAL